MASASQPGELDRVAPNLSTASSTQTSPAPSSPPPLNLSNVLTCPTSSSRNPANTGRPLLSPNRPAVDNLKKLTPAPEARLRTQKPRIQKEGKQAGKPGIRAIPNVPSLRHSSQERYSNPHNPQHHRRIASVSVRRTARGKYRKNLATLVTLSPYPSWPAPASQVLSAQTMDKTRFPNFQIRVDGVFD